MNDLELRIKLWNHLAKHGDVDCSSAWYETQEQVSEWADMTDLDLADPTSNAHKERTLIDALFAQKKFAQELRRYREMNIFDIGCGTGQKAVHIAQKLPKTRVNLYLVDQSETMLDRAAMEVIECGNMNATFGNARTSVDSHAYPIQEFIEDLAQNRFDTAINRLTAPHHSNVEFKLTLMKDYLNKNLDAAFRSKGINLAREIGKLYHYNFGLTESWKEQYKKIRDRSPSKVRKWLEDFRYNSFRPKDWHRIGVYLSEFTEAVARDDMPDALFRWDMLKKTNKEFFDPDGAYFTYLGNFIRGILGRPKPGVVVEQVQADITRGLRELTWATDHVDRFIDSDLFLFLGNTLGNVSDECLNSIWYATPKNSYFLLGVELSPSSMDSPTFQTQMNDIRRRYGDPSLIGSSEKPDQFLRQTTRRLGIPDKDIQYKVEADWDGDTWVRMSYVVTNPEGIHVPHPEDHHSSRRPQLFLPHGMQIQAAESKKFDRDHLVERIKHAGFTIEYLPDRTDYTVILARK